jgi:hypothetical protein
MNAVDLPAGEETPFEAPDDFVVHAALTFGDGDLLMASDDPSGDGSGVKGAALNITLDDHDEARRIFEALADGVCDEVAAAANAGPWARRAIGFSEVEALLEGRIDMAACREAMVHATWRYAKRQMTWCRTQFGFPVIALSGEGVSGTALDEAAGMLGLG